MFASGSVSIGANTRKILSHTAISNTCSIHRTTAPTSNQLVTAFDVALDGAYIYTATQRPRRQMQTYRMRCGATPANQPLPPSCTPVATTASNLIVHVRRPNISAYSDASHTHGSCTQNTSCSPERPPVAGATHMAATRMSMWRSGMFLCMFHIISTSRI